jgi:hypothetical protein
MEAGSMQNAVETLHIPEFFFERLELNRYYTVEMLAPLVVEHYVANEDENLQEIVKRSCEKPKIYDYLEDKILELNKDLTDGGKKMRWCQKTIAIPAREAFFRSVFPTFNIACANERTGEIKADTKWGVLNHYGRRTSGT